MDALCHEVASGLGSIAQVEREHRRGSSSELLRGKQLPSDELRHDIGKGDGDAVHVLLGRSGSQEGGELALKPPIVDVEELVAPRGAGLRCVQLQFLKRLGDRVEAGEVERLDGVRSLHQLSLHRDDEAHVHAWDPADAVVGHPKPGDDV